MSKLKQTYPRLLKVSGKPYEGDGTTITLTIEELEKMESNPIEVFKSFCREEVDQEATPHFIDLFEQAVKALEEETI